MFAEPLITWEKQDVLFFLLSCALPPTSVCLRPHSFFFSFGMAVLWHTHVNCCSLYIHCHEASILRILSRAVLARCASHRHSNTHTWLHTWSPTVDSLLLCQGISHDQSRSFVSPGVKKKLKQKGGGWRENTVGFSACKLFMAEQKCASTEVLQKQLQWSCHLLQLSVNLCIWAGFCSGIYSYDKLNTDAPAVCLDIGIKWGKKKHEAKYC